MKDFRLIFDETEAREILEVVNEKMAAIFCQKPKRIHYVFLSHISAGGRGKAVILGQCVQLGSYDEVQIVVRRGWQKTAIHELTHVYNPAVGEKRIEEITADVVRYLKLMVPARGGNL